MVGKPAVWLVRNEFQLTTVLEAIGAPLIRALALEVAAIEQEA